MSDLVRLVDGATRVTVHGPDDDRIVRVEFGPESSSVTFTGDVVELHRLFVEVDVQLTRLATGTTAR